MLDIEFPWWLIALVYLFAFMNYFWWGAVMGFILTLASESERKRRTRTQKLSLSLLGALGGGVVNFVIVALGTFSTP